MKTTMVSPHSSRGQLMGPPTPEVTHSRSLTPVTKGAFHRALLNDPLPIQPATTAESVPQQTMAIIDDLSQRRADLDGMLDRTLRGDQLSARELLVWQAKVYAYSERLDICSRVVDRTVGAVKTLLGTHA